SSAPKQHYLPSKVTSLSDGTPAEPSDGLFPTSLLSLIFSFMPSDSDEIKPSSDAIVSEYLALETMNHERADQLLLEYINSNSPLCLDEMPDQKLYDFFSRKKDEIYTLTLSGKTMPENLIIELKSKCPNLKRLKIICDSFYQSVSELDRLTHLEIISKFFEQPVEKLKNLQHLVIKSILFNQPLRELNNLTYLEIDNENFNQPIEQLKNLRHIKLNCWEFNHPVEELENATHLEISSNSFNRPMEKLSKLTYLKIDSLPFNQPVEMLEQLKYFEIKNHCFNHPIEKLIKRGTKCVLT
ncbi:MAG: hypothetical protein WAM28_03050, partial [Chlamydiales bacterium]